MAAKISNIIVVLCVIFAFILIFVTNLNFPNNCLSTHFDNIDIFMTSEFKKIVDERKNLSRRLNLIIQKYNALKCLVDNNTADTGAWCSQSIEQNIFTDENLALSLAKILHGKSVASFGDGPGFYKKIVLDTGYVKTYDAYDGSPMINIASRNFVNHLDFTVPQFGLPLYDWIISLEVAEHIPPEFEEIYVENLVRHAREGMIISWAIPNQLGVGHVNTKTKNYVKLRLSKKCFSYDQATTNKLKRMASIPWLKNNLLVFKRKSTCLALVQNA